MKRIIVFLVFVALIIGSVSAATLTAFRYYAFTLDRSVSPQSVAPVESVKVVVYRDNGTTAIDSGYTDDLGIWSTTKLYQTNPYNRVFVSKTGYASEWTRYPIANIDTTTDSNYVIPLRMSSNVGDSTYILSFTIVNGDGSPAVGISAEARVEGPAKTGAGNWIFPPGDYAPSRGVSDSGGLVELAIVRDMIFDLYVAGVLRTHNALMDSTKTLANIVLKP